MALTTRCCNSEHYKQFKSIIKQCAYCFKMVLSITLFFMGVFVIFINIIHSLDNIEILMISLNETGIETDPKFLSFALDSSIIAKNFKGFNMTNSKLRKMAKALSPAYFRIGGTMADRLIFIENNSLVEFNTDFIDDDYFSKDYCYLEPPFRPNFTMNGEEFLTLYKFTKDAGLELLFDLNSLRRNPDCCWDHSNAEELIDFCARNNLSLHWELGNEPDAYRHQFDYEVTATQLAKDFEILRDILRKYPQFNKSLLVGPDTTRPRIDHWESEKYLENFTKNARDTVDAVTWHQYYFNGRTASDNDFLDPFTFNILQWEITQVKDALKSANISDKPLWLGETSSAYGGGAPGLSDRYVASFIWLDKLGLSAAMGLKVVTRQSLYQGYYALLDDNYDPSPDWWVSVIYKKLVGEKVVDCELSAHENFIRLYCHCAKDNFQIDSSDNNTSAVTIFGMNLFPYKVRIRVETLMPDLELTNKNIQSYELTANDYLSRDIYLNKKLLKLTSGNDVPELVPKIVPLQPYLEMPGLSLVFWVVPMENRTICN